MTSRRRMPQTASLRALPSFAAATRAFASPIVPPRHAPDDLRPLYRGVARWDARARTLWARFHRRSVFRRGVGLGVAIGDAIRLQRAVRTRRIDEWLAAAPHADVAAFEQWRDAFFARCDALGALATEALVASDLAMPEDGLAAMLMRNGARLSRLVAGKRSAVATVTGHLALIAIVAREWDFFGAFAARQLRRAGVPFGTRPAARAIARLNALAGRTIVTPRHRELVIAAYRALAERGVSGPDADRAALHALQMADAASGKPWKGLVRLYDVLVYSGLDPRSPRWEAGLTEALSAPIDYTHVPGREWLVRDYDVGKRLMQIDGKVADGDRWAALQQGRSSLAAGYLRGGQDRTEFGRRYSKPLAAFLDSMVVAEGPDHQRQRKAFLPFFTRAAVLEHAEFVERTVTELLDGAARVARANDGAFDLRVDFAYRFPIRVICHMLAIPAADVDRVQHWAECAVRAMDTEAGVGFDTARAGQHASDGLRAYLEDRLARAGRGEPVGQLMATVARDETISHAERVANLGVVIFAGFETTTGLIAKGVEALLRHRAQWEHLRAALVDPEPVAVDGAVVPDREWRWLAWASAQPERSVDAARRERLVALRDRSAAAAARYEAVRAQEELLDRAVEELLRWTAPGTVVPLTASKDVELPLEAPQVIKGCPHAVGDAMRIRRGETIAVAVDELNRRCPVSAGRFDDGAMASRLDVTRADNTAHLSFGLRHACIGAFLAKENAKRALEGIMRRFPDLELAGDPIPQEMELFSGLASLPVRSSAAAAPRA